MMKISTLALAIALSPAIALAANANDAMKATAPASEAAASQNLLSPERIRELLVAQGALHVSPLKRVSSNEYEAKILTAAKGWNKVFIDARTGQVTDDPMRAFRH